MKRTLPPRVFEKSGTYWHVTAVGPKRVWKKLARVREGLPAMYAALAALTTADDLDDMMPKVIADWRKEVGAERGEKTRANDAYTTREIADAFAEFRARQVKPTDATAFLKQFKKTPRSFNLYRAMLMELMRYAEEKGHREPGTNPVASVKPLTIKARSRYLTDSEVRRIKVGAMYGGKGERQDTLNRSGPMLCALIDMAYLTGQRIGDLLTLEWSALGRDGIMFKQGKTGAKVLIEWTPKLTALVDRIKAIGRRHMRVVFTTQDAQPYTYSGAITAWKRALKRAGIEDAHFHDLRSKALTDKDRAEGMRAAQTMGGHTTQTQTAAYVRHKTAKKTGATR